MTFRTKEFCEDISEDVPSPDGDSDRYVINRKLLNSVLDMQGGRGGEEAKLPLLEMSLNIQDFFSARLFSRGMT